MTINNVDQLVHLKTQLQQISDEMRFRFTRIEKRIKKHEKRIKKNDIAIAAQSTGMCSELERHRRILGDEIHSLRRQTSTNNAVRAQTNFRHFTSQIVDEPRSRLRKIGIEGFERHYQFG